MTEAKVSACTYTTNAKTTRYEVVAVAYDKVNGTTLYGNNKKIIY